jgi:ATP-dependent Clp protease ATP-binding subunit ClpC
MTRLICLPQANSFMFERFTKLAVKTILLGQQDARAWKRNQFGAENILIGLLAIGEGSAYKILTEAGVTLEGTRSILGQLLPLGDEAVELEIPFNTRAVKIFERACRAAADLNHNYVEPEHLLIGLLDEAESSKLEPDAAGYVLRNSFGVHFVQMKENVLKIIE